MSMTAEDEQWPSAYTIGLICGGVTTLLLVPLLNYCVSPLLWKFTRSAETAEAPTPPPLSRRERAEKLLEEMPQHRPNTSASAAAAAAPSSDAQHENVNEAAGNLSSSESWESTGDESDEEDEESEDSEYERMEDLRLKMVFVVRHPVQPKMSAQEVAVLTASAGVQLIEFHQQQQRQSVSEKTVTGHAAASPPALPFVSTLEDQQRWLHWYLWWNRIGCAKITLKCPENAMMGAVVAGAAEHRLPITRLSRSQFYSNDGAIAQNASAGGADEVVVIALGPAPSDILEPITGALKLFS